MKKYAAILILCMLGLSGADTEERKPLELKKFETTFTVTYNAITLEEAARLEVVFREKFRDACKVDVALKDVVSSPSITTSDLIIDLEGETFTAPIEFFVVPGEILDSDEIAIDL